MDKNYLELQFKRTFKICPEIFVMTLVTILSVVLVCSMLFLTGMNDDSRKKISVGIVGNTEDPYIRVGLEAVENYDNSQYYLEILEMDEDEAIDALKTREIAGYIYIPDNYIKNIFKGNNETAKYITPKSPEGFGSIVAGEVADIASYVVTESQAGMYSMQKISDDYSCKDKGKNFDKLIAHYVNVILERSETYELSELGLYDSLSTGGYYICGILFLFITLWGITCNKLFLTKKMSLSRTLKASGISVRKQLFCEYLPFLIICIFTLLFLSLIAGGVLQFNDFGIRELKGENVFGCFFFIVKIIPAIVLVTMMQTAIYELIPNNIGAVLAQFLVAMGLGYVSGCFYPNYFFPETIQKIAYFLPTGIGFAYIREIMSGQLSAETVALTAFYIALFAGISILARKHRIEGDEK